MKFQFEKVKPLPLWTSSKEWGDWKWQLRNKLKCFEDFQNIYQLSSDEIQSLKKAEDTFAVGVTPYYASLVDMNNPRDPIRKIFMPLGAEWNSVFQEMKDPLGERENQRTKRIIHRYSDRVLFWVTDQCAVYCRYCTRKHFTGTTQGMVSGRDYAEALDYISKCSNVREVILSGGDPLTLSDGHIEKLLNDIRKIEHIEIIRIGTRVPVANPMRVSELLVKIIRKYSPVFLMTHFNHPRELTKESAEALGLFVDHGIPMMNQMVLLNGINNHPAIVQALCRRLLYLRVKPYYMFQCDPSLGTDHLRTSIDQSLDIQKELWGHLSGLAMPVYSIDIPEGGGKVSMSPDFQVSQDGHIRTFKGWDGVEARYVSPLEDKMEVPSGVQSYMDEWESLKGGRKFSI